MEDKRKIAIKKGVLTGALVSMLAASLTGCGKKYEYTTNEDGIPVLAESVSYDDLCDCRYIQINYNDGKHVNYICYIDNMTFYDIEKGKKILSYYANREGYLTSDTSIDSINYIYVDDALTKLKFIKDKYNNDDIDDLYDKLEEEYDDVKKYTIEMKFTN